MPEISRLRWLPRSLDWAFTATQAVWDSLYSFAKATLAKQKWNYSAVQRGSVPGPRERVDEGPSRVTIIPRPVPFDTSVITIVGSQHPHNFLECD